MHNDELQKLYDELYEKFLDQEEELAEVQARADSYMGTLGRTKDENSRLRALNRELADALGIIVMNAEIQPDARMGGATDIYAVPCDDIENARAALAKARKES